MNDRSSAVNTVDLFSLVVGSKPIIIIITDLYRALGPMIQRRLEYSIELYKRKVEKTANINGKNLEV